MSETVKTELVYTIETSGTKTIRIYKYNGVLGTFEGDIRMGQKDAQLSFPKETIPAIIEALTAVGNEK